MLKDVVMYQMAAEGEPQSGQFLEQFGTPTVLWRLLKSVEYVEPPLYFWKPAETMVQPWFDVWVTIPVLERGWSFPGIKVEVDMRTPWDGAQLAAFEVLTDICSRFNKRADLGPANVFPRVDASQGEWAQSSQASLERGRDERAHSTGASMSAMFAVLRMHYSTRDGWMKCVEALHDAVEKKLEAEEWARMARRSSDDLVVALTACRNELLRCTGALLAADRRVEVLERENADLRRQLDNRNMSLTRQRNEFLQELRASQQQVWELQQDVHRLNNRADPFHPPGAAEFAPEIFIAADDGEASEEEEEEDPEEIVPIDESDDHGGNVSGMDSDHDD